MASKSSKSYQQAQSIFAKNKTYVQKIMKRDKLDALLIPITTHGTATYDEMTVNTWRAPVSSNSGLPSISINIGYSDDMHMPFGIELVGKQFHEGTLIEIAYAYEKHISNKISPTMPEENPTLLNLSIPELNNLFTLLGKNAYEEVLIHNKDTHDKASELTPEKFQKITVDTIDKMKLNLK
jgi:aspartyl-tRNA(Asn)/glutamyl-tRNA(Gln) amidotransferase subunit A